MAESSPKWYKKKKQKNAWEKEKLLVTSNFSFSHSASKTFVLQTRKSNGLFGKGLTFTGHHWLYISLTVTNAGILR